MNYWKGLLVAAAFDAAWIAVRPSPAMAPAPAPVAAAAPDADSLALAELRALDARVDSLMLHVQAHPADVEAMEELARLYADRGWHEDAIGPLARALQIDPGRRGLWVALDEAVERSRGGGGKITDAELVRAARHFVDAVEMWGHGC